MLFYTHIAFGVLSGLLMQNFLNIIGIPSMILYYMFVLLGSMLPDIDESHSVISQKTRWFSWVIHLFFKHRGIFHSLWFALLFSGIMYYFIGNLYGIAFFIGYASHIIADGMTKMGVNILHPIATLHIRGFVETGKTLEIIIFVGILVLIGLMVFGIL